jgi:Tol biopolymer transport system component
MELFSQPNKGAGSAHWSPDGQHIAFDYNGEGNADIYVIRAAGGKPIRLTADPADDMAPSWSRDGRWIYFISKRTGRYEVWKVSSEGGPAIQVSRNGGGMAFESPDGRSVYYMNGDFSGSLWRMPSSGGTANEVLPSVATRAFCVIQEGIYFIPVAGPGQNSSIEFLSFATGKVKTVALMSGPPFEGLSVSPDGRYLLFTQVDGIGSDLTLVENFR